MERTYLFILLVCANCLAWANGDPVATFSALTLSKHPVGRHIPEIQITNENLEITGQGKFNHFKVTYTLTNNSDKDFHLIDYGFPIDWYGNHPLEWGDHDYYSESMTLRGWSDDYVKEVHFSIDGADLPWQCSETDVIGAATKVEDLYKELGPDATEEEKDSLYEVLIEEGKITYPEDFLDLCRRWYYTCFDFAPHQERTLTVEYLVSSNYSQSLSNIFSPFQEEKNYNPGKSYSFRCSSEVLYDFKPASMWGNGKCDQMKIDLKLPSSCSSWDNRPYKGDFWEEKFSLVNDSTHHWEALFSDFDLASAPNINIVYHSDSREHEDVELLKSIRIPASHYTVTVNGKQEDALSDNQLNTACRLAPDSANCYRIRIDMHEKEYISGMIIYYGDASSMTNYQTHRCPDSILVMEGESLIMGEHEWIRRYTESTKHPVFCNIERATTLSWQNLTDVAERISFFADYWNEPTKPRHFTIDLYTTDGSAPYISEIILLGKTPLGELYDKFLESLRILDPGY